MAKAERYVQPFFSLEPPLGWTVERAVVPSRVAGSSAHAAWSDYRRGEVTLVGPGGSYFTVMAGCEPTEPPPTDAYWPLGPGSSEGSLVVSAEEPPCTVGSKKRCLEENKGEALCNMCSAGDGQLDIGAGIGTTSGTFCFRFGSRARETDVDLAPFRELLRGFRALDGSGGLARAMTP